MPEATQYFISYGHIELTYTILRWPTITHQQITVHLLYSNQLTFTSHTETLLAPGSTSFPFISLGHRRRIRFL